MCGRFALHSPRDVLARRFRVDLDGVDLHPRYNIAPSQDVLTVAIGKSGVRTAVRMHWGFVPYWSAQPRTRYSMINAKRETAPTSRAFGEAFRRRRCLILADGFYEWQGAEAAAAWGVSVPRGLKRVPYWISFYDGHPFAMAGLYSVWRPKTGGDPLVSCTILTAPANQAVARIHDRMPIVLKQTHEEAWLNPASGDPEVLLGLLEPEHPGGFRVYPVSARVNSTEHDSPALLDPL